MGEQRSIYDTVITALPNFTTFNILCILVFCLLRLLFMNFNIRLFLYKFMYFYARTSELSLKFLKYIDQTYMKPFRLSLFVLHFVHISY